MVVNSLRRFVACALPAYLGEDVYRAITTSILVMVRISRVIRREGDDREDNGKTFVKYDSRFSRGSPGKCSPTFDSPRLEVPKDRFEEKQEGSPVAWRQIDRMNDGNGRGRGEIDCSCHGYTDVGESQIEHLPIFLLLSSWIGTLPCNL